MRVHSLIPKSSIKTLELIIHNFNLNFRLKESQKFVSVFKHPPLWNDYYD